MKIQNKIKHESINDLMDAQKTVNNSTNELVLSYETEFTIQFEFNNETHYYNKPLN